MKSRSNAFYHGVYDTVRGTGTSKSLYTNTNEAQGYNSTNQNLTAFNANGFTLGTNSGNTNAVTYVSWNWKGGGAAVSNTSGTITSSVSASAASGFSVVTYTGNGTNGSTIGHSIGIAPSMIIVKSRSAVDPWPVYHTSLGNTQSLRLNTTAAVVTASFWNNTTPSSSVFTVGGGVVSETNTTSVTYVAYCFAPIAGFSAFGSYTGNGSADGPFIYCGFRPRWVLLKKTSAVGSWFIYDTARDTYNLAFKYLLASDAGAENTTGTANAWDIDILSNGFKIRNDGGFDNASSATYIYAAFAENPFNNSLAR